MVVVAQKKPRVYRHQTVQTLGGITYAVPQVPPKSPNLTRTVLVPILAVLLSPIILVIIILYTLVVIWGPGSFQNAILSTVLPSILGALANRTEYQRKLLLQHVSGRVLDVGSGSGEYLAYLSRKASHVVCLEPLARLHPALRQKAAEFGFADYQITILSETIEEYTASNPGSSFDWVLLGNVLCHVEDVSCTLRQVDMLLRPGGHVYFSEHLGSKTICTRRFQNLLNPWWRRISGGCNCNRDSLDMIERMESWDVASWQMENLKVGMGPFVMGLARKVETGA